VHAAGQAEYFELVYESPFGAPAVVTLSYEDPEEEVG
jgi:hypothetical protein